MGHERSAKGSRCRDAEAHREVAPAVRKGAEADPDRSDTVARDAAPVERLKRRAWLGVFVTVIVMGLLLFLCAGTVRYWQAWVFLAIFLAISFFLSVVRSK